MRITHVIRGSEYLSSTPKYNLLYDAFGWQIPVYIHLPPVMKNKSEKLSKRNGDASFEDLISNGYLPEAIINYIALLGWSPSDNTEIFSLDELINAFNIKGLSRSPAIFDIDKLTWLNGEYIKKMDFDKFFELANPILKKCITKPYDFIKIAEYIKTRIGTISENEIANIVDFIEQLPDYNNELYIHKKMKTDLENSLLVLNNILPIFEELEKWDNDSIYNSMMQLCSDMQVKNGVVLWPIRTALSGKISSPCGASEMAELFGKDETLSRIKKGIEKLS